MRRHHVSGQGMVEYALILVLIAVGLIGAVGAFRGSVAELYSSIASAIV